MPSTTSVLADHNRGNIAFFSTYRPPVPLEIYSSPIPPASNEDELQMLDGKSYNYNGHVVPPSALKTILTYPHPELQRINAEQVVVDSGLVFVSERTCGLETLHFALRLKGEDGVKVFNFAQVYGTFSGVRMEDSGRVAGDDHLVYVSTMERASCRRQPWTAVYITSLEDGTTRRLTPPGVADLSPAVSPSGKKIAVASFEKKGGWDGEIEDLMTAIYMMNVDEPHDRTMVIENGGWPTWGSEDILFFHRYVREPDRDTGYWAVFKVDLSDPTNPHQVTPPSISAITPAAIDKNRVAVATIRLKSELGVVRVEAQYRHVEIFDSSRGQDQESIKITRITRPLADHFNPFVILDREGKLKRIGYHRCRCEHEDWPSQIDTIISPKQDVGLCRVAGAFPSFSKRGAKVAFVDNDFKDVYIFDEEKDDNFPRRIYKGNASNSVFSPVWNQDPKKDTLYICMGPSFSAKATVHICAINNASTTKPGAPRPLTAGVSNNAFPSTNAEGTRLVFRSTRDFGGEDESKYKNLYIMENAQAGETKSKITRLTIGKWTDTHCEWSPNQDWIVFSSTRDKPQDAPATDNKLDPGYFAVYLVNANKPDTVVRVVTSGYNLAGHVNHPFFSPDGKSIVVTSDLAGVSVDPISLPHFLHSVRPYGDLFTVDIDLEDLTKKLDRVTTMDVGDFTRITHSRFENSLASWATPIVTVDNLKRVCDMIYARYKCAGPICPYLHEQGGHTSHLTGHLQVPDRLC